MDGKQYLCYITAEVVTERYTMAKAEKKRFTLDLDPPFQRRLKVIAALKGVTMRQCAGNHASKP